VSNGVLTIPLASAQRILKRVGLYHRLKTSPLYDIYWKFANPRVTEGRDLEIRLYQNVLGHLHPGALIFDVGANHGAKTDIFLRLGARVIAVDPDESNARLLGEQFHALRLRPKPVVIVPKALSATEAVETMWVDSPGSAKNTLNPKWVEVLRADDTRFGSTLEFAETTRVETTTLDRLIETYGVPRFIKIDVEGFEAVVLHGLSRPVPCLSFEVNLPEFRPEGLECVTILSRLSADGLFNYTADYGVGLALGEWLQAAAFAEVLQGCADPSIEVFWKSSEGRS
jgi:FkbM family methyltransferase